MDIVAVDFIEAFADGAFSHAGATKARIALDFELRRQYTRISRATMP